VQVRSIGGNKLLLIVNNSSSGANGLWIMNGDGTHMLHLNSDDTSHWSTLNAGGQYTWSNVSPDGTMYALLSGQPGGGNTAYTLLYGNLNGGPATIFASAPDGNDMMPGIVGWTTM
jgi:hypothetical protein